MVQFRGKCASCGASWNHRNFRGRRNGRAIPEPCFVPLRKERESADDRICTTCYDRHLKRTSATPKRILKQLRPVVERDSVNVSSKKAKFWSEGGEFLVLFLFFFFTLFFTTILSCTGISFFKI